MTRPVVKPAGLLSLVFCATTIVALVVGASASSALADASERTNWSKNSKGQTYGNALYAKCFEDEPDLMAVWATNGKLGYAYRTDLEGPAPSSPEEALRLQAEDAGKDKAVPVYAVDGETQIGVFVIQGLQPDE